MDVVKIERMMMKRIEDINGDAMLLGILLVALGLAAIWRPLVRLCSTLASVALALPDRLLLRFVGFVLVASLALVTAIQNDSRIIYSSLCV